MVESSWWHGGWIVKEVAITCATGLVSLPNIALALDRRRTEAALAKFHTVNKISRHIVHGHGSPLLLFRPTQRACCRRSRTVHLRLLLPQRWIRKCAYITLHLSLPVFHVHIICLRWGLHHCATPEQVMLMCAR